MGSEDQDAYCGCCGGGDVSEAAGLGLPRIAESIEYSRLAASEPKVKVVSKVFVIKESFWENASAGKGAGVTTCGGSEEFPPAETEGLLRLSCSSSSSSNRYFAFLR
jgi:hypothetical protein